MQSADTAALYGNDSEDNNPAYYAGCTSVVSLITKTEIYTANAGDSRSVVSRSGTAKNLSTDHKPDLATEKKRILKANGFVEEGRVNGSLALSRALGDL
jgi:serine/threonine protein phosphatase PrpC